MFADDEQRADVRECFWFDRADVNGDIERAAIGKLRREAGRVGTSWEQVVRLVHDQPVRPAGTRFHFQHSRQQLREELRPVRERNAEEIHHGRTLRIAESVGHILHPRQLLGIADVVGELEVRVIPFRIDDEHLIARAIKPFHDGGCERRFAAAGRAADHQASAGRVDADLGRVFFGPRGADRHAVPPEGLQVREVVREHAVDQFRDAGAVIAHHDDVGRVLDRRQSVGDRCGALAQSQESVVVLGVADADRVVRRQTEFRERRDEAGRLVHARWQDHHRALVEDDLQFEPIVVNGLQHFFLMRFPGRDDDAAGRDRADAARLELGREARRRRLSENARLLCLGVVDGRAVLHHGSIEEIDSWEDRE